MTSINKDTGQIPKHPTLATKLTLGQKASDKLTRWAGSWAFIISFGILMAIWIVVNTTWILFGGSWDPYPFILLNLALSMLAALQAPIILMSQNRQSEKDRLRAKYDYATNRRAEREIRELRKLVEKLHSRKK